MPGHARGVRRLPRKTIVDVQGGFSHCRRGDFVLNENAAGLNRTLKIEETFDSVRIIPAEQAVRERKTIRPLDAAIPAGS